MTTPVVSALFESMVPSHITQGIRWMGIYRHPTPSQTLAFCTCEDIGPDGLSPLWHVEPDVIFFSGTESSAQHWLHGFLLGLYGLRLHFRMQTVSMWQTASGENAFLRHSWAHVTTLITVSHAALPEGLKVTHTQQWFWPWPLEISPDVLYLFTVVCPVDAKTPKFFAISH